MAITFLTMYNKNQFLLQEAWELEKIFYRQKINTRKLCLCTIKDWTKNDQELIIDNIII